MKKRFVGLFAAIPKLPFFKELEVEPFVQMLNSSALEQKGQFTCCGPIVYTGFKKDKARILFTSDSHQRDVSGLLKKAECADFVVDLGDICWQRPNKRAMIRHYERLLELGKPVFTLPGNHDVRYFFENWRPYFGAARNSEARGLYDLSQYRIVAADGFTLVSNPFVPVKKIHIKQLQDILQYARGFGNPIILVGHANPTGNYIDYHNRKKEGYEILRSLDCNCMVFGHQHSSAGLAEDFEGRLIQQGEFSETLLLNASCAKTHRDVSGKKRSANLALLEIDSGRFKYGVVE